MIGRHAAVCSQVCRLRRLSHSDALARARRTYRRKHPGIWTAGRCIWCGDPFVVMRRGGSVCAKVDCRRRHQRWYSESAGRCRKFRAAVLERDGMVCYLCGQAIDPSLPGQHAFALTLDHVQPRTAGGRDTLDNLRPAHRRCNSEKGDDLPGFWERIA
jgi:5-methylcytosine-specific restriction endonuclease McrA